MGARKQGRMGGWMDGMDEKRPLKNTQTVPARHRPALGGPGPETSRSSAVQPLQASCTLDLCYGKINKFFEAQPVRRSALP